MPFVSRLSMAFFITRWQNQVAAGETVQPAKCKMFTVWSFTESLPTTDLDPTLY